jgi:acyl-CoA synthetase (AMP-forming)/AMP-acid ligase II
VTAGRASPVGREPLPQEYRPRTIPELLLRRAEQYPQRIALTGRLDDDDVSLTFAELHERSDRLAAGLVAAGLAGAGLPVAWALSNEQGVRALTLYHGVLKTGSFNVPVNPRLAPAEIAGLLEHCGAQVLVGAASVLENVVARSPALRTVDLTELDRIASTDASSRPSAPADPDDLASVLYTSGTTGVPKGVEHTHGSSLAAGIAWADCFRLRDLDVVQSPFPASSGAGLHFNGLASLWAGAHVVFDETRLPDVFERIDRLGATLYVAVPSIYQYWLASAALDDYSLASLRIIDYGGASMAPAVIERLAARLPGVGFMQTYGFTEAGPGGTYLPEEYSLSRLGSIGARAAGRSSRIRVVDDAGDDVPPGVDGELLFCGPSVMRGYHRDPVTTAAVFVDGWLRSGDVVRFDDEGFLYFVDRKRDLIVRGGYNIAPVEIEQVLLRRDDIVDASAFALAHEHLGEVPAAVVVVADQEHPPDEAELIAHCARLLADFKTPIRVFVVDEIPKTPAGKALRRVLRDRYASMS